MNLIAPFGFYGCGNIGDEATLQGFARLLSLRKRRGSVWVASGDPDHTARVEPAFRYFGSHRLDFRRWLARLSADVIVFPGGTPIMDVLGDWPLSVVARLLDDAEARELPVAFVGTGTERLHTPQSRRLFMESIGPRVGHWTVRSRRDAARLTDLGVDQSAVTVAADLAWLLEPVSPEFGRQRLERWRVPTDAPILAVNVMAERAALAQAPALFVRLAAALDRLIDRTGHRVLFLANEVRDDETFDAAAAREVLQHMRRTDRAYQAPTEYMSPQQMMSVIGCCRATVSMRYHFCLFSALQGVPFIALERSDKVADLRWDLGWPCGTDLPGAADGALDAILDDVDARHDELTCALREAAVRMRERSCACGASIAAVTGSSSSRGRTEVTA